MRAEWPKWGDRRRVGRCQRSPRPSPRRGGWPQAGRGQASRALDAAEQTGYTAPDDIARLQLERTTMTTPPNFDPATYKEATRRQWERVAAAWNRWGPTLERWWAPVTEAML